VGVTTQSVATKKGKANHSHLDFVITLAEGHLMVTFQIQRYVGADFVGETHWSVCFGTGWPPVIAFKEET
jgi:hypothetical protein